MRSQLVNPRYEVLYSDLDNLGIGHFLQSREFKKLLVLEGFDQSWRNLLEKARDERTYIIAGHDHDYGDNLTVFIFFINMIEESEKVLQFVSKLISIFILEFKERRDLSNIIEDFELLGINPKYFAEIKDSIENNNNLPNHEPKATITKGSLEYSKKEKVFVVHGHDNLLKTEMSSFLITLGLKPIILNELPLHGETIIENIENYSDTEFAIILMTGDDLGRSKKEAKSKRRARQNVILELGYFLAKLGRNNISIICENGIELPSDINGILYIIYSDSNSWKLRLANELSSRGFKVDLNKLISQK